MARCVWWWQYNLIPHLPYPCIGKVCPINELSQQACQRNYISFHIHTIKQILFSPILQMKYCKMRTFSREKFSLISPSKKFFRWFNFHYSMVVLFYITAKITFLEAFHFHRFASSAKIAKINRWNFLVLQYLNYFFFLYREWRLLTCLCQTCRSSACTSPRWTASSFHSWVRVAAPPPWSAHCGRGPPTSGGKITD